MTEPVNRRTLVVSNLSPFSAWFATHLFEALPELRKYAFMEGESNPSGPFELLVEATSPTGDSERTLFLWIEKGEPSVAFGAWHTHSGLTTEVQNEAFEKFIDLIRAILVDSFVLCYDVGGEYDGHCGVLDLRDAEALTEEITSKDSPGKVNIRSWSGSADRQVSVDNI